MAEEDDNPRPEPTLDEPPVLEGGDEDDDEGGGFSAKKILIIVIPLILLLGGGAGLYFSGMLDSVLGGGDAKQEASEDSDGKKADASKGGDYGDGSSSGAYFLEIPNMVVNLSTDDGQPRYLRLSVQLELTNSEDVAAIESVMPRVVDQFQTYLRELRVRDLQGSQGIYRLQMELLSRVNAAAYPIEVKDVLFQEILIQ